MGIKDGVAFGGDGEPTDFSDFYTIELAGQLRSATLILGSRSSAEDVVHESFAAVFRIWDDIDEPGAYLQKTTINRCRDMIRREQVAKRHRHLLVTSDVPEIDVPLYDALAELPFNHRAAVVLRFYLQLSEAEIADHLGCAQGSVGPWIRRGLNQLAKTLRLPTEELR